MNGGSRQKGGLEITIAVDFAYVKPATVADALGALAAFGPEARLLAGGTDLVPWMRDDLVAPTAVVDLKGVPGLDGIRLGDDGGLELGALATFTDLTRSEVVWERFPVLVEMSHEVASPGIRNRATVVGNICSAVPSCDAAPVLMAYGTDVHVVGSGGSRVVPIGEWFVAPHRTALRPGEIVTHITIHPAGRHGAAFAKLARYAGEDLAQANLAVVVTETHDYAVAFGAVAPTPVRAGAIEALLRGRPLDDPAIAAAQALVADAIAPITDIRATAEYREHMCRVMLARALRAAGQRLSGQGPPYPTRLL